VGKGSPIALIAKPSREESRVRVMKQVSVSRARPSREHPSTELANISRRRKAGKGVNGGGGGGGWDGGGGGKGLRASWQGPGTVLSEEGVQSSGWAIIQEIRGIIRT